MLIRFYCFSAFNETKYVFLLITELDIHREAEVHSISALHLMDLKSRLIIFIYLSGSSPFLFHTFSSYVCHSPL